MDIKNSWPLTVVSPPKELVPQRESDNGFSAYGREDTVILKPIAVPGPGASREKGILVDIYA